MRQSTKTRGAASLGIVRDPSVRLPGHHIGRLVDFDAGKPVVDYRGNPHGPLPAETTVALSAIDVVVEKSTDHATEVLLVFESERSDRPVIVGLVRRDGPEPAQTPSAEAPVSRVSLQSKSSKKAPKLEAVVDGKRVVLDAQDEIVLKCGEASVTLRRNGRIVIRGVYVETRSSGVNRIKGGTVQIN